MYHSAFICLVVLFLGSGIKSQPLPGRLQAVRICNDCAPVAMSFIDSAHGLVLAGKNARGPYWVFRTTDAGRSWRFCNSLPFDYFDILDAVGIKSPVLMLSRDVAICRTYNKIYMTTDSGFTWKVAKATESNEEEYIAGSKFYDSGKTSFHLFVKRVNFQPSCFQYTRPSYDMLESFGDIQSDTCFDNYLYSVYFEDSLSIWSFHGYNGSFILRGTSNGGKSWEEKDLTSQLKQFIVQAGPIIPGKDKGVYFIPPEMIYTEDNWKTWKLDSSFSPGRISR